MRYEMKTGTKTVQEVLTDKVGKLSNTKVDKIIKEKPVKNELKEFTVTKLEALIDDCLIAETFNGLQMIAMKHGVKLALVKQIIADLEAEYNKRNVEV